MQVVNNRRIAKNTLFLYIRMLVTMAVSLYTARVIIKVLGIDDYGIYNIVGGVVVLFSFMNNALRGATQRFLSYELGKDNIEGVNRAFSMSLQCHCLYAVVLTVLALTIGLWFVVTQLNIPEPRREAALIVYVISIITFIINIFQTPFLSAIIAFERMSFYAYFSIFDVIFKLLVVFALYISGGDKLVVYSVLIMFVAILTLLIAIVYCFKDLKIGRPKYVSDKRLFKQMFGFAGWSMYNGCSFIGAQQGGNILVNIFSGVAANGAFGIANQVSNILYSFVTNFQSAIEPQIVKSYSAKQYNDMFALMNRAAYFSYYIFLIIAVPIIIEIEFVLSLWLGNCPDFAANFCRILLLYYLVDAIEAPLWMLIGATGKIKVYSIWSGTLVFMSVPLAWSLLCLGYSVYWVFIARLIMNFISAVIRPIYLKQLVPEFSLGGYLKMLLSRVALVSVVIFFAVYIAFVYDSYLPPIAMIAASLTFTVIAIWTIGMSRSDRFAILSIVKAKLNI